MYTFFKLNIFKSSRRFHETSSFGDINVGRREYRGIPRISTALPVVKVGLAPARFCRSVLKSVLLARITSYSPAILSGTSKCCNNFLIRRVAHTLLTYLQNNYQLTLYQYFLWFRLSKLYIFFKFNIQQNQY